MEGATLKSRAVAFALAAGTIVFVLVLLAISAGHIDESSAERALLVAGICAVITWATVRQTISRMSRLVDAAIGRMTRAAHGDLDGEVPPEIARALPQLAGAMEGLFRQITANLDSVHRLAMYDPVTGLPNRTHFRRSCERLLADMGGDCEATLFFIDLDRFKAVNDTLGHAMGDMLLGMVANRLRTVADRVTLELGTPQPVIGRLAGDEFTMFFPQIGDAQVATRLSRGVLFALGELFDLHGNEVEIGASIGIAQRPRHGTSLTELMRAADAAMYHAKGQGRGRAEHFNDHLAAQIADRAKLESDLREAIARNQFTLAFQPQLSVKEGRIVAAEALLRWRHPSGELRLPAAFLKRAEETGMIVEIGEWVIATIADTIARWGRMGIEQRLAINISARQLDHADFFRRLREAMHKAEAPAHLLELEITETLAMSCSDDVIEAIAAIRADGATIAIDDFGTGYSNLARLRDLPIDRVKLDPSLIEHVATRAQARSIVHAVIGLVHGMGCECVAEGIETDAQAEVLRIIGCDVVQGYAIARPMDEAAFIAWSRAEGRQALAG